MCKKIRMLLFIFLVVGLSFAEAATTATALITYSIGSIDSIAISGNPPPFVVHSAIPGSGPSSASDSSTSYTISTNNSGRKITGVLNSNMPTGVTFSVNLQAPTGAVSSGLTALSAAEAILVTGISNSSEGNLTITYTLTVDASAAPTIGSVNAVTYTIGP